MTEPRVVGKMNSDIRVECNRVDSENGTVKGVEIMQTVGGDVWRRYSLCETVDVHTYPDLKRVGMVSFSSPVGQLTDDIERRMGWHRNTYSLADADRLVDLSIMFPESMWDDLLRMMHELYLERHPELK